MPLKHALKSLLVVSSIAQVSLFSLGAKRKPRSYKDHSSDLEHEKYLAAFELALQFVISPLLPSTGPGSAQWTILEKPAAQL